MCRTKESKRIITTRAYYLASGCRYFYIRCRKQERSELVIDFVNNGGTANLSLLDSKRDEVFSAVDPQTKVFRIPLTVGESYKLKIVTSRARGSYTISL